MSDADLSLDTAVTTTTCTLPEDKSTSLITTDVFVAETVNVFFSLHIALAAFTRLMYVTR